MSILSDRAQDDIEKNLARWLANGDYARSVEQQAYAVADRALESSLEDATDIVGAWREAGMPDASVTRGLGILQQMYDATIETFVKEDFAGVLDDAVSTFIDQHANDAVLDCLAQYGWEEAWTLLVAGESQEGEDG